MICHSFFCKLKTYEVIMFVEYEYPLILEDFNSKKTMELSALVKMLENAGNKHSDIAKDNMVDSTNNGKAWILTDWFVELDEIPVYGDKIKAVTWSEPAVSIFTVPRNFLIYDNDKQIGKATTRWAILDLNTLRPSKIEPSIIAQYEPEDKKVFEDPKLPKIAIPDHFDIEKEIQIRRSDIDYNNHVHNLVYIDYAMDTLPKEIYENRNFKHLHITYRLAVLPDEKIICKYAQIDSKHIFCIFSDDGTLKTQIELY